MDAGVCLGASPAGTDPRAGDRAGVADPAEIITSSKEM